VDYVYHNISIDAIKNWRVQERKAGAIFFIYISKLYLIFPVLYEGEMVALLWEGIV